MKISPLAGKPAPTSILVDVPQLIEAYYNKAPDPAVANQRVAFGTSGHRGSSFTQSFNENHILAITQAICDYRKQAGIDGPLFIGADTHAHSKPALQTAVEVLTANKVQVMLSTDDEFTPTPAISLAIINHNRGSSPLLADGIVITPSHNPPDAGGFKYNPPHGGPAEPTITNEIQNNANNLLEKGLSKIKRVPFAKAVIGPTIKRYNYLQAYVNDLANVVDMKAISSSNIHIGVDPLGGAGVHYWQAIADKYKLNLTVVNKTVDPTFRFMTVDWDGQIRMDPSSPYAMQSLIDMKNHFDIAFACDTDHDRHGIVTKSSGLLPPNHYLSAAIFYLFQNRPLWPKNAAVGKTVVSSQMIDRVTQKLGRDLYEVPVGFKWFVEGLSNHSLAFGGEESAGASFARLDGTTWTTDKDGIILALLAAEMTAKLGKDPGEVYQNLTAEFGAPAFSRIDAPATPAQKKILQNLSASSIPSTTLAGETISSIQTKAPGNGAAIGGIKVIAPSGWFAARPSGTEDIYKLYGESFKGQDHLTQILTEAQAMVDKALTP